MSNDTNKQNDLIEYDKRINELIVELIARIESRQQIKFDDKLNTIDCALYENTKHKL